MIDRHEVDRRFTYYPSTETKMFQHEEVRRATKELGYVLADLLPEGREKATVLTKLEEVSFHANAAIARHQDEDPGIE